jgi:hypothetical protein
MKNRNEVPLLPSSLAHQSAYEKESEKEISNSK